MCLIRSEFYENILQWPTATSQPENEKSDLRKG